MSNENQWQDDEVFDDKPEAAQTGKDGLPVSPTPVQMPHEYAPPAPLAAYSQQPIAQEEYEIEIEESEEQSEEDENAEILSDANLRLEQGSLYKSILKHELFEGMDADPKAIQNVQKAIRKFAREQMERMLGMRPDPETSPGPTEQLRVDFPFNALEVEVLKQLAFTATKGATEHADNYEPTVSRVEEATPVVRRNTLNPIRSQKKAAPKKQLPSKPSAPLKRSKIENTIDDYAARLADNTVSKEMIKEGLRRELAEHDQLLGRPIHTLTAEEVLERNRIIDRRRGGQVKSTQAIPMPSAEQQATMVERAVPVDNKPNRLVELALKMPPSKLLNPGS